MKKYVFIKFKIFLSLLLILSLISSCSFFNHKTVELAIDSSPQGAEIFINQQSYGTTPALIKIEPQEYIISLNLDGYGSSSFKAPIFTGSIRTHANGSIDADGVRCLLDLVSVVFSFHAYTGKCADFKQKHYKITIPKNYSYNSLYSPKNYSRKNSSSINYNQFNQGYQNDYYGQGFENRNNGSIVGAGHSPENVINYYYNQGQ